MKKTINSKQLQEMIAMCVKDVLAESRKHQVAQKNSQMNEDKFTQYVQRLVNEEVEKEGFGGRLWGGVKGIGNAIRGEYNKAKQGVSDTGLSNEYKGQSFGKRMNAAKNMIKGQARQGDMAQELNNLMRQLANLELNGYFNKATKPIADQLYSALEAQVKSGENFNVKGAYKKGYGQSMPQSQQSSNGMGSSHRDASWDPNGFGTGAAR